MAAISLAALSAVLFTTSPAGAAAPQCIVAQTMQLPTCTVVPIVTNGPSVAPESTTPVETALPLTVSPGTSPAATTPAPATAATSALPFTGADIVEIAIVGVGAVVAGSLLLLRRRQSA